jgi:hypothetical protein
MSATAMAAAFASAGFVPVADRLLAALLASLDRPETIAQPELERSNPRTEARLKEVALAAVRQSPRNWDGAKDALYKAVRNDPELLWEMFQPYRAQAAQRLLTEAAAKHRQDEMVVRGRRDGESQISHAQHRQGGSGHSYRGGRDPDAAPSRKSAASIEALAPVAAASLLDTFRINGRAVGDMTPEDAEKWAASKERDARFVRLLTQNLPPGRPIREFRSAEDAALLYAEAEKESGNE